MKLTMTAAIQARWAHRVDGLIHSHAWTVEATVEGPADADKVIPADDLERLLRDQVQPWVGHYLTDADVGPWQAYEPLVWDREPTVEEIVRQSVEGPWKRTSTDSSKWRFTNPRSSTDRAPSACAPVRRTMLELRSRTRDNLS